MRYVKCNFSVLTISRVRKYSKRFETLYDDSLCREFFSRGRSVRTRKEGETLPCKGENRDIAGRLSRKIQLPFPSEGILISRKYDRKETFSTPGNFLNFRCVFVEQPALSNYKCNGERYILRDCVNFCNVESNLRRIYFAFNFKYSFPKDMFNITLRIASDGCFLPNFYNTESNDSYRTLIKASLYVTRRETLNSHFPIIYNSSLIRPLNFLSISFIYFVVGVYTYLETQCTRRITITTKVVKCYPFHALISFPAFHPEFFFANVIFNFFNFFNVLRNHLPVLPFRHFTRNSVSDNLSKNFCLKHCSWKIRRKRQKKKKGTTESSLAGNFIFAGKIPGQYSPINSIKIPAF